MRYDVIVVGAGPAGATAARLTASRGLSCCLMEKHTLPRAKPCGGGLWPSIRRYLDLDYAHTVERVASTVSFLNRGTGFVTCDHDTLAIEMVSRSSFDHFLAEQAVRAGATLREGQAVTAVREHADRIEVRLATGDVCESTIVIAADGAKSIVARAAGLAGPPAGLSMAVDLVPRDRGALEALGHRMFFSFHDVPEGYGWVFPKRDHFSVGVTTVRPRLRNLVPAYHRFCRRFPFLTGARERFRRGGRIPFNRGFRALNTARVCLIGDAAGLVDPMTGEGICHAVQSGALAAEIVAEQLQGPGRLTSAYTRRFDEVLVRDLVAARWMSRLFFRCAGLFYRNTTMVELLAEVAQDKITYRNLWREALRRGCGIRQNLGRCQRDMLK